MNTSANRNATRKGKSAVRTAKRKKRKGTSQADVLAGAIVDAADRRKKKATADKPAPAPKSKPKTKAKTTAPAPTPKATKTKVASDDDVRLPGADSKPGRILKVVTAAKGHPLDMTTIMSRASADEADRRNWTWQANLLCQKGLLVRGKDENHEFVYVLPDHADKVAAGKPATKVRAVVAAKETDAAPAKKGKAKRKDATAPAASRRAKKK